MARTKEMLTAHLETLAQELQGLGFKLNRKKCSWKLTVGRIPGIPSQLHDDDHQFAHRQSPEGCRHMLKSVTARDLAHLIGLLSSMISAVTVAPLHYRALQRLRHRILSNSHGDYDQQTHISEEAEVDLHWWVENLQGSNGRSVVQPSADMVLTTDASKSGWGATDQSVSTGGMWTREERTAHINYLELKAVLLALQTFASARRNLHILLLVDNSSAIAYLNQKGGTHSKVLSDLAVQIWEWCLTRKITIHAEHIPGVCNTVADAESRGSIEPSDRKLDEKVFLQTARRLGSFRRDSFCSSTQPTTPSIFQLPTRPRSRSCGRTIPVLGEHETLRFPSVHSDWEMPSEDRAGSGEGTSTDSTGVAESDMVSKPPGQADRSSDPLAKYQEDRHQPNGGDAPTGGTKQCTSSRLQGFRTTIQDQRNFR